MAAPAGTSSGTNRDWVSWYHDARLAAGDLPELLVEASQIAHTVAPGLHGRRRRGVGETFWQFRRYTAEDAASRIDWRRSARDDHLYIREQEWEAAHTVWLWPDRSASMRFRSELAPVTKEARAIVLALALGELLVRGGERIAVPGLTRPSLAGRTPRHIAEALARIGDKVGDADLPPAERLDPHSEFVVASDLLAPFPHIEERVLAIAGEGVRVHLVQILDPVEESFPFEGRTEFVGPQTGLHLLSGRAETLRDAYRQRLREHRDALQGLAARIGGTFLVHHTDKPPYLTLLALHGALTAERDSNVAPRQGMAGEGTPGESTPGESTEELASILAEV